MTQAQRILALLRRNGESGVTAIEMLEEVGSFRLAARIFELRAMGHLIDSEPWRTPSGKVVSRYILHEKPEQLPLLNLQ